MDSFLDSVKADGLWVNENNLRCIVSSGSEYRRELV